MAVSYEDLELAFEFVGAAPMLEHQAYLCRETGKI